MVKTALSGIAAAAPAAVAALGVVLVVKGVSAYTNLGAQVLQVKSVIGGTAEQASTLVAQFNALGINTNAVDKSINALAVSIASGKDKLNEYGIQVAKDQAGNVDLYGTLDNIRQVYQSTTDATERDTIANQLKVRGLQNLIPLLAETNDQQKQIVASAQTAGNILTDKQVTQAKELGITMKEAGLAVKGLEVNLAEGLAPSVTGALKIFTDLTSGLKNNRAEQAALAAVVTGLVVPGLLKLSASLAGPLIGTLRDVVVGTINVGKSLLGMGTETEAAAVQTNTALSSVATTATSTTAVTTTEVGTVGVSVTSAATATAGAAATIDTSLASVGIAAVGAAGVAAPALTSIGLAATTTATEVTTVAPVVAGAGVTMASVAGPIGLLAAVVIGLGTAFRNTGTDAKTFVATINQGYSTDTASGLQGQIAAESKALADLQTKLDAAKKKRSGNELGPSFLTNLGSNIADKITGSQSGNQQYDAIKAKIDALTETYKTNQTALSNVNQAAKDMKETVAQVFAQAAAGGLDVTTLSGNLGDLEAKLKAAGSAGTVAGTGISAFGVDVAAVDKTLVDAVVSVGDAQKSLASANKSEEAATIAETKAHAAYISIMPGGIQYTKDLTAAKKAATTASNDLEKAEDTEKKAQEALSKARAGATALDLADAASKITLAGDTIGKDKAAVGTAQEKLDALEGSGTASQATIIAAQADVKDAQDTVTQSIIDQSKAQLALTTLKQKGTEADPAVVSAEEALANAHDSVTSAQERQQTAADALRVAQVGDADKITAALDTWNQAQEAIPLSQDAVAKATFDLAQKTGALNDAFGAQGVNLGAVNAVLGPYTDYMTILNGLDPAKIQAAAAAAAFGFSGGVLGGGLGGEPAPQVSPVGPLGPLGVQGTNAQPVSGARALGGPVDAGKKYLVGEKGPEEVTFGLSGTVTPNPATLSPSVAPALAQTPLRVAPASSGKTTALAPISAASVALTGTSSPRPASLAVPAPAPSIPTPPGGSNAYLSGANLPAVSKPEALIGARAGTGDTNITQHVTTGPITSGASASDIARSIAWRLLTLPPPPQPSGNN